MVTTPSASTETLIARFSILAVPHVFSVARKLDAVTLNLRVKSTPPAAVKLPTGKPPAERTNLSVLAASSSPMISELPVLVASSIVPAKYPKLSSIFLAVAVGYLNPLS